MYIFGSHEKINILKKYFQLDVVELLVQNGSDLNALTNNHETPFGNEKKIRVRTAAVNRRRDACSISNNLIYRNNLDICEDPEMKSRLAALRSEQESRARDHHQKNRSRSQNAPTNTRSHSIRRNSTRDKGQISKKQIKNEAIFGIQNVHYFKRLLIS